MAIFSVFFNCFTASSQVSNKAVAEPSSSRDSRKSKSKSLGAPGLFFLEADGNTPAGSQATQGVPGSQGTQGVDSLSVRTRAVAQFLEGESSITSTSEDVTGDLSLDKILEGKTRKLCARMFYETLALPGERTRKGSVEFV